MMTFRRLILPFILILTGAAVAFASIESDGIVVTGADSRIDLALSYDPDLDNYLPFVMHRIFVQWADSLRHYELTPMPEELIELLHQLLPRIFVQWADSRADYIFVYPVELFDDTTSPTITNIVVQEGVDNVIISWDTDEYADSRIECGIEPSVYTLEVWDPLYVFNHSLVLSSLIPGQMHYCQIGSTDRSVNEARSDELTFTTGPAEPLPPNLVSPTDTEVLSDTTPTLDWDPSAGAVQYQLQVDNNNDFSSPEVDVVGSSTDHTPVSPLADNIYYWRVRAQDAANNWGNWSSVWSFVIKLADLDHFIFLPVVVNKAQSFSSGMMYIPVGEY